MSRLFAACDSLHFSWRLHQVSGIAIYYVGDAAGLLSCLGDC